MGGNERRTCAGPARHRLAHPPLPHPDGEPRFHCRHELHVRPLREPAVMLEARADALDVDVAGVGVDEQNQVRVSHRDRGALVRGAVHVDRLAEELRVRVTLHREVAPAKARRAHVDRDAVHSAVLDVQGDVLDARPRGDGEVALVGEPGLVDQLGETTDAVAAHLRDAPVGIVVVHEEVGVLCACDPDEPVRPHSAVAVADRGDEPLVEAHPVLDVGDQDEVVPRPVVLREPELIHLEGTPSARPRARPRRARRPRTTGSGDLGGTTPSAAGPARGFAWPCARRPRPA